MGRMAEMGGDTLRFIDRDTYPARRFAVADGVRVVPGGASVRTGAYVAKGVAVIPPSYINVGAYVDEGTMVDSHALVGSCAQIGKRVHLSAAAADRRSAGAGERNSVIIEDDVLIGGNTGVYEGTIVRKRAVLAAGTVLTRGTPRLRPGEGRDLQSHGRDAADRFRKEPWWCRVREASQGQRRGVGPEPGSSRDCEVPRREDRAFPWCSKMLLR